MMQSHLLQRAFECVALIVAVSSVSAELIDGTKVVGISSMPPAVAFMCGKPAMYQTDAGWQRDDNEFCLQTSEEILAYCKERYPNVEIVNVVPSPAETTIESWCNAGETASCGNVTRSDDPDTDIYDDSYEEFYGLNRTELERIRRTTIFNVRPFRCLVGPFQADALMIPDTCKFSHIDSFDSENCSLYADWNYTATQQCSKSKMALYSVAVLLPCSEPGKFSGAEFVCCPSPNVPAISTTAVDADDVDVDIDADVGTDGVVANADAGTVENDGNNGDDDCFDEVDYYRVYESSPWALGSREHQRYQKAHRCVQTFYTRRKEALIRGMTDSNINFTDSASRLEADATFRRAYSELDAQWVGVRREMNALHQRRVQDELSTKSAAALDTLDAELDEAADNDPHVDFNQVNRITSALKSYISRVQKEQLHWVDRYEFLERHHPQQLAVMREQIKNYLFEIHLRLNRSLDMLRRVPEFEKPIRDRITQFLMENSDIDTEVKILFPEGLAPTVVRAAIGVMTMALTVAPQGDSMQSTAAIAVSSTVADSYDSIDDAMDLFDSSDVDESDLEDSTVLDLTTSTEIAESSPVVELKVDLPNRSLEDVPGTGLETSTRVIELDLPIDVTEFDELSASDAGDSDVPDEIEASELKALQTELDVHPEVIIVDSTSSRLINWSQMILLSVSAAAVFITLVIIIVVVRRSSRARRVLRLKPQTSVVDVDARGLLESEAERGFLGNMQANGYENPTYVLYDKTAEH